MSIKTIFRSTVLVTALMCLTFVTAWAQSRATQTVTKTVTWKMDGGVSGSTTLSSDSKELFSTYEGANQTLRYTSTDPTTPMIFMDKDSKSVIFWTSTTRYVEGNCEIVFPDIEGKVTKVELKQAMFSGDGNQKLIIGIDKNTPYNDSKLLHIDGNINDYDTESYFDETIKNFSYVGSLDVNASSPLKLMFVGEDTWDGLLDFRNGEITITYETEEEVTGDSGHIFTFDVSGNTLIATCNSTDANHTCELANRKATLMLIADDVLYNYLNHNASLNLADFISQTGLQVSNGGFTYRNKETNTVLNAAPLEVGSYSVTCTVTIDGQEFTLSKDFKILAGEYFDITNNYPLLSVSATSAHYSDVIYIKIVDESVTLVSLSVNGTNTNLSISNYGIHYNSENATYNFTMPNEAVTINATFETPIAINCNNGGSVSASVGENTNVTKAQVGKIVTLTATPDEGYSVTNIHVYNGNEDYIVTNNGDGTYSFTMPASAVTVEVEFSKTIGALTISHLGDRTTATIDGSSDYSLPIAEDIEVDEVTYSRTFIADGGAYTIMLPFDFTVTDAIKGTFHTLSSIAPTTENPAVWKAEMSDAITSIEANKPYIFVPSEDFSEMTFNNVTLKKTTGAPLTNVCENTNWKLHGVYDKKVWTDDDKYLYGFAAADKGGVSVGEFVHFVTDATLRATRCYLEYSETGFSKSAVVLPEKIIVVFPETSSVIEPNDPENNGGDVITPVSEITPNSGTKVWSADRHIVIESKAGDQYRIIDLNGRTLRESRLAADREEVTLSRATGIVIVKINGKTFKVNY